MRLRRGGTRTEATKVRGRAYAGLLWRYSSRCGNGLRISLFGLATLTEKAVVRMCTQSRFESGQPQIF